MLEWIVSANVLIIAVIVGRRMFRHKISCWVQYSLWLLVAVRLLVPVSPLGSVLSIANLLPQNGSWQDTERILDGNDIGAVHGAEPGQNVISRQEDMSDTAVPEMSAPAVSRPTAEGHVLTKDIHLAEEKNDFLSKNGIYGKITGSGIWEIIGIVWLTGACLLALWLLWVNGSFRWRVYRNRLPLAVSGDWLRLLQEEAGQKLSAVETAGERKCRMRRGTGKQLSVYVTDEISTPCMYGLLRPAIYITPRVVEDSQVLAMVLCHERMHYRHGDHIWSAVRMLCLCIHWYNPLVWAAVGLSRQDGELACDEGVLRQLGEKSRKRYGEALLALSMEHKTTLRRSLNLATSMSDTRKQLKERLSALVKMPRMAAGTAVLVSLLALGLMACTFTSRTDVHEEDSAADKAGVMDTEQQDSAEAGDMGAANAGVKTESDDEMKTASSMQSEDNMSESGKNPQDAEESHWLPWVLAEEYTGYLDECGVAYGEGWEAGYKNQDYDGDGLIDRIYQDVESEPGIMKMRVEFGNGEILAFDTYENSPLVVQSMDMDEDGSPELLFTKPNEFSTNPMSASTDILLFTRREDGYRQVEIALEEAPEEYGPTPLEVYLVASYGIEDDSHIRISWRVPGAEGDLKKTQVCLRTTDEQDMEYYKPFMGGRSYVVAYDAKLIQKKDAYLRLYFEGLSRSGDILWVDMALKDGELSPVNSAYEYWYAEEDEMVNLDPEEPGAIYENWDAQTLEYYDEEGHPVAKVTEGEITRKLTFVETSWSVSAADAQFSREVLYWACQALLELEQWTGMQVTEVCYTVSEWGDFSFGLTPGDMQHDRTFYSRCYNGLSFTRGEVIESIDYFTDMDVWYSPVKQYITPPGYDKMTTQERLIWYFERSAIARGSKVAEVIYPWEGDNYLFRTDQGTYYEFVDTEGVDTLGKGLFLMGPYDDYPQH